MYCHHFNRDYEIKILISLLSPMLNNHELLVDFNLSSFVRRVAPMVPSSPLDNFSFLKLLKEDNKEKHKLLLGTNVFPRYTITAKARSSQISCEAASRGNGFQLSGNNTQREEQEIAINQSKSIKLSTSFLQT